MQVPVETSFNAASTAADVARGIDLRGKLVVVTGGSAGLGKETARVLALAGADVFLGARSAEALERSAEDLGASGTRLYRHVLDLMDPGSVAAFARAVLDLGRPVDILVNNAGIMANPLSRSALGVESQLATNYLGHAQLSSLLAPALIRSGRARVVCLSSVGHHFSPVLLDDLGFERRPYDKWLAYGQSKTADVLLAVKLAASLGGRGVTALAVHPGMIPTDLGRFLTAEDIAKMSAQVGAPGAGLPDFKTVETGAATSVWAATAAALDGKGPLYLEDCHVASVVDQPNRAFGVLRYALDADTAERLWASAERLLDRRLLL
jgi:NAD(P)-dependent dehydrogenase (short-subunit alcohol dehydrogenase family)